ncbi:host-nuclease inhibitor Gam family protein [Gimesia aquarii]|uniref:Bacteriophage Mu Gam like protein n=1 Tax=Gimesia aquarii TaxID=2527964 RepID=A0A517VRG1_9PLAN|nr:host-nuclease inhibitor Gam family protein [Gimesia aquarii]QDT95539.1 Bacteriophage Mu Gam like protein [Gimesia aquarii]
MSKTLSAADRPSSADSIKGSIESEEDLDKALHELSFLNAYDKSVDARCSEQIESIKRQYERKKVLPCGKTTLQYTKDRYSQLSQMVIDYCNNNRSTLISRNSKTRKFPHGSISFKVQPSKVEYRSGLNEEGSMKLLDKLLQSTLIEMIMAWLKSICIFGKNKEARLLSEVIELKPRLSVSKIKKAFEEGRLTTDHLKQLGLKYSQGKEQLTIKPAEYEPG